LGTIISGLAIPTASAAGPAVADLQDLKIIGHYFTTGISNDARYVSTKDPSKGRSLVLVLSATSPKNPGKVFDSDFTLRYFHTDGNEDRAKCDAIARADEADAARMFAFARFNIGEAAWVKLDSGPTRFGVAFYVEPDVEIIDIHRIGSAELLTYRIGTERLISVAIYTNIDDKALARAKDVIQKGGYNVVNTSDSLAKDSTGITIHYREAAETQAREISQRLTAEFGTTTTVKLLELVSAVDIVVWIGK
jgi:hypothetical protein